MYSIEEAKTIRRNFWERFDKYSKKRRKKMGKSSSWILQNTGIKGFNLKFDTHNNGIQVGFEIAAKGIQRQLKYHEKMLSLRSLLNEEFEQKLFWNDHYITAEGNEVFRIYTEKPELTIFDESKWDAIFEFFFRNMIKLEDWFLEYRDIIKMNEEEIFNDE